MAALHVKRHTGGATTVSEDRLAQLTANLRGDLIRPNDASYDGTRKVNNGMHDHRPALIIAATGVADVIAAVKFAAEHDALLAVRGGGHSVAGFSTCDDGIVLDLKRMKGIRVDPARRTVRAEGGCTWGDLNHATYAFGLATTGGMVSTTGIAGLTLGGGVGYLARTCGLACDNLVSADVVTADGRFVSCSQDQEQDLFWALRGGGGNFGVVTSFEFRLHPIADIFGGPTFFAIDANVLRGYREFIAAAPEQLGAVFGITVAPPLPFLPAQWHGRPVSVVIACWSGPLEQGEAILKPLADWAPIVGAYVARMPYPVINTLFDELLPAGLRQYWKGMFASELSDQAISAHLEHGAHTPCVESSTLVFPVDAACQRVAPGQSAYAYRDAAFSTVISGAWWNAADDKRNTSWVRAYYDALRPFSTDAGYVNFMADDDGGRVRANYGDNYARLLAIKSKYDPDNLFQLNQNIRPNA